MLDRLDNVDRQRVLRAGTGARPKDDAGRLGGRRELAGARGAAEPVERSFSQNLAHADGKDEARPMASDLRVKHEAKVLTNARQLINQMLVWLKAASSGEIRRSPDSPKPSFTFDSLVEVASKDDSAFLHAQVADEQHKRDSHRPPLGALVVDVNIGDCEIGARLVGRPAELTGSHHALDGPRRVPERGRDVDRRKREVARESILVEEYGAMVLDDHMEVLRKGSVSDEPRPCMYADNMPRAIEVRSQQAQIRTSRRSRIPGKDLKLVGLTSAALNYMKGRTRRSTGRLIQELGSGFTNSEKVRNESGVPG